MISEISKRYAKALYEVSQAENAGDSVLKQLTELSRALSSDAKLQEFLVTPLIAREDKINILRNTLSGKVSQSLFNTLQLLANKNRLHLMNEIIEAYEFISDQSKGMMRGVVRSAAPLNADEKVKIENTVNKVINKKVVLNFEEDKNLMGGLIAQVGGWTFDDSLKSHLDSINEDLNRRSH